MNNKIKQIIIISLLAMVSCNKESLVEGYIPTKPVVINVNKEIAKATKKDIPIVIDKVSYSLNADYIFNEAGTIEVRKLFLGISNSATSQYLQFLSKGSSDIGLANIGELINPLFISSPLYTGQLFYSLNDIGNTNYSYYTINNVTISKLIYVPFKTVNLNNQGTSIYGYFSCKIEADKFTIYKCVYRIIGDIKAGDE